MISSAREFFTVRRTGATHLRWWGDNTSSQMKNQFLFLYCAELVRDDGFAFYHRIDNKYSPPGHTFMVRTSCCCVSPGLTDSISYKTLASGQENDRAFGVLSRKAKKTKVIGSSKAWMALASKAKKPAYHTMWMGQPKFRDWKEYLSKTKYKCPSVWKNTLGGKVPFLKVARTHT